MPLIPAYLRRTHTFPRLHARNNSCLDGPVFTDIFLFFCPICGYFHEFNSVGKCIMPCGFEGELIHAGPFIRRYKRLDIIGKRMEQEKKAGEPPQSAYRFLDEVEAKQVVSDFWNGEGCLSDPCIREIIVYLMDPSNYPYGNRSRTN
jgi:hypothetical protein